MIEDKIKLLSDTAPILLIEDDIVDIKYVRYGLTEHGIQDTLIVASNGAEALDKIYGRNQVTKIDLGPKIILLDINLPKMNGFKFLKILRSDPQFVSLPVFILSGSNADSDKIIARDLNVSGYFVKPLKFDDFLPVYKRTLGKF